MSELNWNIGQRRIREREREREVLYDFYFRRGMDGRNAQLIRFGKIQLK